MLMVGCTVLQWNDWGCLCDIVYRHTLVLKCFWHITSVQFCRNFCHAWCECHTYHL